MQEGVGPQRARLLRNEIKPRQTHMITNNEKQDVQGNRQGGGDQTGKNNRPQGYIPPWDKRRKFLEDEASEARDPQAAPIRQP
jgi:hypothetical protein